MRVPAAVGTGKAKVTITLDGWKEGHVASSSHEVNVVASKFVLKLEPVSSRLKGTLTHSNKKAILYGLRYSPDGKRIIAGDYPGGVVQLWDVETGKQLTTIETGHGYRGSAEYIHISPDWETVYVSRAKRKISKIEKNSKRMYRWEFDGEVRAWDMRSGKVISTFKHNPPRNVLAMALSPDGTKVLTAEELPGEFEARAERAASLWDVKNKAAQPLPKELDIVALFAPDGKTIAASAYDRDSYTTAMKLFDVAASRERLSIRVNEKFTWAYARAFTPDSKVLIGFVQTFPGKSKWKDSQSYLKFWDAFSGKEIASFAAQDKDWGFGQPYISPDGNTLVVTCGTRDKQKLLAINIPARKIMKTIALPDKTIVRQPAFSPDGKWIGLITQVIPSEVSDEPSAEDCPQPRIHLIDAATAEIRETIICPQGFTASLCFSPDGKTLASGGHGKVLLWDLTKPPGETIGVSKANKVP